MRDKKVRIAEEQIKFFLEESHESFDYPSKTYDDAIEVCLLMAMFNDVYPGTFVSISKLSGYYYIRFTKDFFGFFPPKDVIFQEI
ncbi:MAG: hypothetical protein EBT39_04855 [Sphingobacteriia bacterium]|nr:hypothetical protein [Candidatus Fonsibacter lacus]